MGKASRRRLRGGPVVEGATWVRQCRVRLGAEAEGPAQASSLCKVTGGPRVGVRTLAVLGEGEPVRGLGQSRGESPPSR